MWTPAHARMERRLATTSRRTAEAGKTSQLHASARMAPHGRRALLSMKSPAMGKAGRRYLAAAVTVSMENHGAGQNQPLDRTTNNLQNY